MIYSFNNNLLYIENIPCGELYKKVGSPFYVYSKNKIINQFNILKNNLSKISQPTSIHYAIKANSNLNILKILCNLNCGVEIVSGGELEKVILAGFNYEKIIFSGVGKTAEELEWGLHYNIGQFSVESLQELILLNTLARKHNKNAPVCLRINPNIDPLTHKHITTGSKYNKFGIPLDDIKKALEILESCESIKFLGLSAHLGSQIFSIDAYCQLFILLNHLINVCKQYKLEVRHLDLGGGFGIPYKAGEQNFNFPAYIDAIAKYFGNFKGKIIIEPGRFLVAESGILLTKVLYKKKVFDKTLLIVDAGMNDMMRTALYEAAHEIIPTFKDDSIPLEKFDIVGPVCESTDYFAKDLLLPQSIKEEDILAITCVGAYGTSLSSLYNSRALIPEVLIDDNKIFLIREKINANHLTNFENLRLL